MNQKQKKRLIEALEIRQTQLAAEAEGKTLAYRLHNGHHYRDVITTLAVLRNNDNAEILLKNLPTEKDLPT